MNMPDVRVPRILAYATVYRTLARIKKDKAKLPDYPRKLSGIKLSEANLSHVDLRSVDLTDVDFNKTDIDKAGIILLTKPTGDVFYTMNLLLQPDKDGKPQIKLTSLRF